MTMKKRKILSSLCLSVFTLISLQNVNSQTLDDYLRMASENNPGLQSKYREYLAALEKLPQASALPDPQLSSGLFIKPMERYMGNQVAGMQLMQMFPWFGTLRAARNEAALMARSKYEAYREARSALFFEVKTSWYELYLLEQEISVTRENIEILHSLEKIALTKFKSGDTGQMKSEKRMQESSGKPAGKPEMSGMGSMTGATAAAAKSSSSPMEEVMNMTTGAGMVDILRIHMELKELESRLALLTDSRKPLTAKFNQLLNAGLHQAVALPEKLDRAELPLPLSRIPETIDQDNPMLKMLEQEEQAFEAREEMNRKMGLPMIGLGLQYEIFKARPGEEGLMQSKNMLMPMISVSIPLWRKKYTSAVNEARILRSGLVEQQKDWRNELFVSYEDAHKDLRDAERRIALYSELSELAQQALNILTAAYLAVGRDFEELLRMQQKLLDFRLKLLEATVDQNIAAAVMERLMGW